MRLRQIALHEFTKIAVGVERPEDVAVASDGRVFVSDHRGAVALVEADGYRTMGPKAGAPNGINLDAQGRVIIANFGLYDGVAGPLERFDPATGQREVLVAEIDGRKLTSSNYPVIDSKGNIWCTHSTDAPTWPDALDGRADGFVYVLRADGTASIVATGLKFPNGCALSADETFFYLTQTTGANVLRFRMLAGARLGPPETYGPKLGFISPFKVNPNIKVPRFLTQFLGYTDGIGFDTDGNLWVTQPTANKIVAITPQGRKFTIAHDPSGDILNSPTNVTWGGPDMCDLYVGSLYGRYVLKARSPVPGQKQAHG